MLFLDHLSIDTQFYTSTDSLYPSLQCSDFHPELITLRKIWFNIEYDGPILLEVS